MFFLSNAAVFAGVFLTCSTVLGIEEGKKKAVFAHPDDSNWVDPTARFNLKKSPKPTGDAEGEVDSGRRVTEEECSRFTDSGLKNRNDLIMLRHVLRSFVTKYHATGSTAYDFDVMLRLQRPQLEQFERLLDNPNVLHSGPIIEAWNDILQTLKVQKEPTSLESVERKLGFRLNLVIQALIIISLPFLIIYMETKIRMSLLGIVRRLFQYVLLLSFIISFPWTWFRMYQEKLAEQQRHLMEKSIAHCEPLSAGQFLKRSLGNFFSMSPETSPCEKYYRAVTVNPFLDVPPTMAIVVTITNFVVEPLKHIGKAFGEFFQGVLSPLPFYMYPVVIIFILFITFLLIITRSNYEVHLPWLFARIKPGGHPTPTRPAVGDRSTKERPSVHDRSTKERLTMATDDSERGSISRLLQVSSESERELQMVRERTPSRVQFKEDAPAIARSSRHRDAVPPGISKSAIDTRPRGTTSRSPSFPDIKSTSSSSDSE